MREMTARERQAVQDLGPKRARAVAVQEGILTLRQMRGRLASVTVDDIEKLLAIVDYGIRPGPSIVCLCGSTRFAEHMNVEAQSLTLKGVIVVRPEVVAYSSEGDPQRVAPDVKAKLDELHFRKIDLADRVVVVTVDGYIGESTAREIAYAQSIGRPVTFADYGHS